MNDLASVPTAITDVAQYAHDVGEAARTASRALARSSTGVRNDALRAIAGAIRANRDAWRDSNRGEIARAG